MAVATIDGNLLFGGFATIASPFGRPCFVARGRTGGKSAIQSVDPVVTPDLKWPNDVLIGDQKICGILTEMNAEAIRVRYIVVGIGINVNQESFPKGLNATSLQLVTGKAWSRVELVAALLKSLDTEYHSLIENSGDHKDILQRFAENSSWVKGKEGPHRGKWARDGRCHRRFGSSRVSTASHCLRNSDSVERHGTGTMKDEEALPCYL